MELFCSCKTPVRSRIIAFRGKITILDTGKDVWTCCEILLWNLKR